MHIAIGQVWRTRGGEIVSVKGGQPDHQDSRWLASNGIWLNAKGRYYLFSGEDSDDDLAELIQDVAPSEPIARAGALLQAECHGAAAKAGWWNVGGMDHIDKNLVDLVRGEGFFGKALVAQKLCLIHSEISEAMEGHRKGLMDDKLPHRPMIEVELADVVIRVADLAGALGLDLGGAIAEKMEYNRTRADHQPEARAAAGGKAY